MLSICLCLLQVALLFTAVKPTGLALPDRAALEGISTSLFLPLNRPPLIRVAAFGFTYSSSSVPPCRTPSPRNVLSTELPPWFSPSTVSVTQVTSCSVKLLHVFRTLAAFWKYASCLVTWSFLPFPSEIRLSRSAWPSPPLLSLTVSWDTNQCLARNGP